MILQWIWIPALRRQLQSVIVPTKIGKAGAVAVLGFLRNFVAIGALVLLVALIAIAGTRLAGGIAIRDFDARIDALSGWKATFSRISEAGAYVYIFALLCILGLFVYRSGKTSFRRLQQKRFETELERLKRAREAGTWVDLPPTPEMQQIEKRIAMIEEARTQLGEGFPAEGEAAATALKRAWVERDLLRRMDLNVEHESPTDEAKGWRHVLALVFFNKGFLTTLETSQKWMGRAGTALLFVGLLGIGSANMGQALADEVVQIDRLRVELTKKDAEESRRHRHAAQPPAPASLPAEDEARINQLTRIFNRTFARAVCPAQSDLLIRAAIQKEIVNADHRQRFELVATPIAEQTLDPALREGLQAAKTEQASNAAADRIGQRFQEELRAEVQRLGTERWEKIKTKVKDYFDSFQIAPDFDDIHSAIAREVIGRAVDAVPGDSDSELTKLAVKTVKKFGTKGLESAYTILSEKFLNELGTDKSLSEAAMATAQSHFAAKADTREWRDFIETESAFRKIFPLDKTDIATRNEPPSFRDRSLAHLDEQQIKDVIQKTQASLRADLRDRIDVADAVSTFDRWFPSQLGIEAKTLAKTLTTVSSKESAAKKPEALFATAHSFERLRGSQHVGGVLMGRNPEAGSLELDDLSWIVSGNNLRLTLHRDGGQYDLGEFAKELVHRALAYAADDRPCTVTILSVEPTREHRVALNPTLLDTRTGMQAIALDTFAFDLIEADPATRKWWRDAKEEIEGQGSLYKLAYLVRWELTAEGFAFSAEEKKTMKELRKAWSADDRTEVARRIVHNQSPDALQFLRRKTEFFDQNLVDKMRVASLGSNNLEEFCQSIRTAVGSDILTATEKKQRSWLKWPPPRFSWVSGVRELPFELKKNLDALRMGSHSEQFWPLEFTLQVAFHSAPIFSDPQTEEVATFDTTPWIVADSKQKIETLLEAHLTRDDGARIVMEKMRSFALLQRLFRCAISGTLGSEFPVEKLVTLAAISGVDDYTKTPRWTSTWTGRVLKAKQSLTQMDIANPQIIQARTEALPVFDEYLQFLEQGTQSPQSEIDRRLDELIAAAKKWADLPSTSGADSEALTAFNEITNGLFLRLKFRELRSVLRIDSDSANLSSSTVDTRTPTGITP